jgi:hypothetical protein
MLFFPFINIWKCAAPIVVTVNGIHHSSDIGAGSANSAWGPFLGDDGELVKPLPSSVNQVSRIFYAQPRDGLPTGYNRVGEQWVLKWNGRASEVSISGASSSTRSSNRILWTWGSNTSNMWVTFAGIDHNDPPRNIRLCERRFENRLDAGEIFNPDWLGKVQEGSGIVRFMTWQSINFDVSTLRFTDIPEQKYCSYGGSTAKPFIRGGMPLSIMSSLANRVRSHPWICIPNVLGTRKLSSIASISNGNPAVISSPGHKWENGEVVISYGTNWPKIERGRWTVIDSDQKAGTFALAGVDSTGFGPYTSRWGSITAPFELNIIANEVASLVAHFRDNIATGLVTYYEFGNELWNAIFNAFHWLAAQARGKIELDDSYWMSGYLAAHFMKVIHDTYGSDSRHKWRGVLATQTVNPYVTQRMISGINQYIQEHDLSLKITDLFNDLAVTGYFDCGNLRESRKAIILAWIDTSEQRWKDGLESTKYSYFNRVVNEDAADGRYTHTRHSIDKIVGFWRDQKVIADANGLSFIQYEGGNSIVPDFIGDLPPAEQQRVIDFYKHSCHTIEDARNYTSMFDAFIAMGGNYPAKFVEAGPVTRFGNWGGLRYPGDSNPVWDAVVTFNKRA